MAANQGNNMNKGNQQAGSQSNSVSDKSRKDGDSQGATRDSQADKNRQDQKANDKSTSKSFAGNSDDCEGR